MTVALLDVVLIAPMIVAEPDLADWHAIKNMLHRWHWARKPLAEHLGGRAIRPQFPGYSANRMLQVLT
ncbi:hypothetical protein BGW80DRAFT_1343924 [Lactifluus volemus]|nr:hypothetical protein BGW80DRAFT_1343924 [Lactifluus volemus]